MPTEGSGELEEQVAPLEMEHHIVERGGKIGLSDEEILCIVWGKGSSLSVEEGKSPVRGKPRKTANNQPWARCEKPGKLNVG